MLVFKVLIPLAKTIPTPSILLSLPAAFCIVNILFRFSFVSTTVTHYNLLSSFPYTVNLSALSLKLSHEPSVTHLCAPLYNHSSSHKPSITGLSVLLYNPLIQSAFYFFHLSSNKLSLSFICSCFLLISFSKALHMPFSPPVCASFYNTSVCLSSPSSSLSTTPSHPFAPPFSTLSGYFFRFLPQNCSISRPTLPL